MIANGVAIMKPLQVTRYRLEQQSNGLHVTPVKSGIMYAVLV